MLIHATCVALNNKAVLLTGPPGAGKSDLALRLIDSGALLVADDHTLLSLENGVLTAAPPPAIAGVIEIRHIGLMRMPFVTAIPVALHVTLTSIDERLERLPDPAVAFFLDQPVQQLRLPAFAASTPAKIRAALFYTLENNDRRNSAL